MPDTQKSQHVAIAERLAPSHVTQQQTDYPTLSPSLEALPLDITSHILECCTDLNNLLNIVKTAPVFLHAFQWKPRSITTTILSASNQDYADALALAEVQILYPPQPCQPSIKQPITPTTTTTTIRDHHSSISTLHLIAHNAHLVSYACKCFEVPEVPIMRGSNRPISKPRPKNLNSTERARFMHAYYRTWTFVVAGRGPSTIANDNQIHNDWRTRYLATTSPRELWRLREICHWVNRMLTPSQRRQLGIPAFASVNTVAQRLLHCSPLSTSKPSIAEIEEARRQYPWEDATLAIHFAPNLHRFYPENAWGLFGEARGEIENALQAVPRKPGRSLLS